VYTTCTSCQKAAVLGVYFAASVYSRHLSENFTPEKNVSPPPKKKSGDATWRCSLYFTLQAKVNTSATNSKSYVFARLYCRSITVLHFSKYQLNASTRGHISRSEGSAGALLTTLPQAPHADGEGIRLPMRLPSPHDSPNVSKIPKLKVTTINTAAGRPSSALCLVLMKLMPTFAGCCLTLFNADIETDKNRLTERNRECVNPRTSDCRWCD